MGSIYRIIIYLHFVDFYWVNGCKYSIHGSYPIGSMYGIFAYIYHKNQPNVGKYTIHGWYGYGCKWLEHRIQTYCPACDGKLVFSSNHITEKTTISSIWMFPKMVGFPLFSPSILGYPYFWKHPFEKEDRMETTEKTAFCRKQKNMLVDLVGGAT